ncbi:MAG: type I-U CRISPR-associated protein Csx17 [Acidobacteria bacterium]|nr:type I-U CRISPR-associated protein Csx17 [Acidobacteriota bacterium]
MSYLKALGVLRIVSEQKDPEARGCWRNGRFELESKLDRQGLTDFVLNDYMPTPIIAPWGARSGFFKGSSEKTAREAIDQIIYSTAKRFDFFRDGVRQVRELLKELKLDEKAEDEEKLQLLVGCRAKLGEPILAWLDACYVLTGNDRKFPPLLGTGGNEGSGSYVSGFAQQVVACLVDRGHDDALSTALFGEIASGVVCGQMPGHFSPSAAGGANAGQGFSGRLTTNRWDYLLCLEGTCLWASSVSRRFGRAGRNVAAFPFTVNVSGDGASSLAGSDSLKPKQAKREVAEMWLPLWSRPTSLRELTTLLSEGRVSVGRRLAETGLDFARAASSLGVDRGISEFERVVFLMRNGQSFMGISTGRVPVAFGRHVDLLREIDPWLADYRRTCGDKAPPRFPSALRRVDRAIFDYCRYGGTTFFQAILIALGQAEAELATGEGFRTDRLTGRTRIRPLEGLSSEWIEAAGDGSTEFELALALAGMHDPEGKIGPIRANLEPVDWRSGNWAETDRAVVWNSRNLCSNMVAVLNRRLMDGARAGCDDLPLFFFRGATRGAIARFLAGDLDERRLEQLLWGLILVDPGNIELPTADVDATTVLPRQFALLKLLFLPFPLPTRTGEVWIKPEPGVLSLLAANRIGDACQLAMRRLRSSGVVPLPRRSAGGIIRDGVWQEEVPLHGSRLAAALLVPISWSAIQPLAELVLRNEELSSESV